MSEDTSTRLPEPAAAEIRLTAVLHALADPLRLRIARELAAGHMEMSCIAFGLPVNKSTSTHHFRVLREAGVIRQHRRGTSRMSTLRRAELDALFPGLLEHLLAAAAAEERREDVPDPAAAAADAAAAAAAVEDAAAADV